MRTAVIGAGIAGLAAAVTLADHGYDVEVRDADQRSGGKLRTSPFAGVDAVDEGADAYLTRSQAAVEFAARVGVADLVHPNPVGAAIWHGRLHDLPAGLMLGVPADWKGVAATGLLSWRGKARALYDLVAPRSNLDGDNLGALVRSRLGDEVHERLIDTLIGSIYATDTDRASLSVNPQFAALATNHRSLILGARSARSRAGTATGPIFAAPRTGVAALADAAVRTLKQRGATIRLGAAVEQVTADGRAVRIDDEKFDAVVVATPANAAAPLLATFGVAAPLATIEAADIAMVRLAIPRSAWPERLAGYSGYLVPKPDQRLVTAASFGSQKWSRWAHPDHEIVRVSLGRDGLPVMDRSDDEILTAARDELATHLGIDVEPVTADVIRWTGGFAQYRPGHDDLVADIERSLPESVALAGASYFGIGIPACIAGGRLAADQIHGYLREK